MKAPCIKKFTQRKIYTYRKVTLTGLSEALRVYMQILLQKKDMLNILLYPRSLWHCCFINQQAKDITSHQEDRDGLRHKKSVVSSTFQRHFANTSILKSKWPTNCMLQRREK